MPHGQYRLLSLDGGGVRGLSSLMILRKLMETIDPDNPPKPCDYFDMIGGTSTGGLIAIMLGRLRMTVDECIDAYASLSAEVFEKKAHRIKLNGNLQGRFDSKALEQAIKKIVKSRDLPENELMKDPESSCKVFVCATSKETGNPVCLGSYRSPRHDNADLLRSMTIWQAGRATAAATTFFDPIAIGPYGEEFVDGALGTNNPVDMVWNEAKDLWPYQFDNKIRCLVSIGTGMLGLKPIKDDVAHITATLQHITTETEATAERFHRAKSALSDQGRYFRFNVSSGLENIGLEESQKMKEIVAATRVYVGSETVFAMMKACAGNLTGQQYHGPYKTSFTLSGVPVSGRFVQRPAITAKIAKCLLPSHDAKLVHGGQRIFVLHGLGGIGKTQLSVDFARHYREAFSSVFWWDGRSEERLRLSIANCAKRIPEGQIPESAGKAKLSNDDEIKLVANEVLSWLALEENSNWLLIFDNVDKNSWNYSSPEEGTYDINDYLPGDHGSVLVTTRLARLAQRGEQENSERLAKADQQLSASIFEKWYGQKLNTNDDDVKELLHELDGLPLALAQAASYIRETGMGISAYVEDYKTSWDELMTTDDPPMGYDRSAATTWTISAKAIEARCQNAAHLLRLWGFLDNKELWHGLLEKAIQSYAPHMAFFGIGEEDGDFPAWVWEMGRNRSKFLEAMRVLLNYSMVETNEGGQDTISCGYSMHPVVHKWTGHLQDQRQRTHYVSTAAKVVGFASPSISDAEGTVWKRMLFPHAIQCSLWISKLSKSALYNCDKMMAAALNNFSNILADNGQLFKADELCRLALFVLRRCRLSHKSDWRQDDATSSFGKLTLREAGPTASTHGRELPDCPADINEPVALMGVLQGVIFYHMGFLYYMSTQYANSETMFHAALEVNEHFLGRDDWRCDGPLQGLMLLYETREDTAKTEEVVRRRLNICEKEWGPHSVKSALARSSLAQFYMAQGYFPLGEEMFQEALAALEIILPNDHGIILTELHSVALRYIQKSKPSEAILLLERAVQGYINQNDIDSASCRGASLSLARAYIGTGKFQDADHILCKALGGPIGTVDYFDVVTIPNLCWVAAAYFEMHKLDKAQTIFEQVLDGLGAMHRLDSDLANYTRQCLKDIQDTRGTCVIESSHMYSGCENAEPDNTLCYSPAGDVEAP